MHFYGYLAVCTVLLVLLYFVRKKSQQKKRTIAAKPGTVVLHQFHPSRLVANGSPPCLKLETFLRMAKIPYECDYNLTFSKKGKMPWIAFNGLEIADSNFCIQFLSKEFNVDIDCHLTSTERAIGHCVRTMLEENSYWGIVHYRWFTDYAEIMREHVFGNFLLPLKYLVFYMTRRRCKRDLWSHGIGRHSEEELYGIVKRDMLAVSNILGQKKFLFGTEKPCLADVALFSFIVSGCWDCPASPFSDFIRSELKNLDEHAQRMKELYYPDWDEIISKKAKLA